MKPGGQPQIAEIPNSMHVPLFSQLTLLQGPLNVRESSIKRTVLLLIFFFQFFKDPYYHNGAIYFNSPENPRYMLYV